MIPTELFKLFLSLKGLMTVEVGLEGNVDIPRSMVHKSTASTVHVLGICLPSGLKQSAFGGTDKMIHRNGLTWKKVTRLEHTSSVFDHCLA